MNHIHLKKLGVVCLVFMLIAGVSTVSFITKKDRSFLHNEGWTYLICWGVG